MSSLLRGDPPPGASSAAAPPAAGVPAPPPTDGPPQRNNNTLTVIAGVGVLLLAMGVGVLIGRSSSSKPSAAPAQVISVSSPTGAATGTTGAGEATFAGDWPAGTSGYTVQLQTLSQSGTSVSSVESAKSAASAKGAKAVGALKSEEFTSLSAGSYVIYSGVYHKKPEAENALAGLKKSFPGAKVIKVSNGGSGSSGSSAEPSESSPGGVGTSENHPAPPTVLKSLKSSGKGGTQNYEKVSKNLPDVVED